MLCVFLALFVVGTVAHASGTTAMTLKMELADIGGAGMGDCGGCDGENDFRSSCDLICVAPCLADISADSSVQPPLSSLPETLDVAGFSGQTGPPALNPPQNLILNKH